MKTSTNHNNRFLEIDSIRGIAALIIMVHHYSKYIYSATGETNTYLSIIEYGKYTVEFFFVISGLLIFMTLENTKNTKDFIFNRFTRLYPAYWICVTITTLVLIFSPYNVTEKITLGQYLANLTMFQHWFLIKDIDGIYWTLAVEMCFYIFIYLVFKFKKQHLITEIGLVWLAIMLIVNGLNREGYLINFNLLYWIPLLKNGSLFFGGILILQLKRNPEQIKNYVYLFLTLACHLLIANVDTFLAILVVYVIFVLFIKDKLNILKNNALVFFGTICFPLYLLHQFIGYEIINFMEAYQINSVVAKIIMPSVIIISLASLVTYSVEKPAMEYLRKKFNSSKK